MTLCLTNTMKRTKEPFAPASPDHVTMYVCGPTVYNFAHIGNARPAVVFDVLLGRGTARFGDPHATLTPANLIELGYLSPGQVAWQETMYRNVGPEAVEHPGA